MKRLQKTIIAIVLALSVCVGSIGATSTKSEASLVTSLIKWEIKSAVKHQAVKAVASKVKKGVTKVKKDYSTFLKERAAKKKKKIMSFKVSSKSKKLREGTSLNLKPKNCYSNTIKWKSSN